MTQEEIDCRAADYAHEKGVEPNTLVPIPKKDLEVGATYGGECRNASKAVWNGKVFTYKRYKFGDIFDEDINHFEDDDGYDVFVPFEKIKSIKINLYNI